MPPTSELTLAEDHVDRIRESWLREHPDLDTGPLEVIGRIRHIGAMAFAHLDRKLSPSGVTRSEFDVLCSLVRSPEPLRASEVIADTGLSGASITKCAEQLVALGLVTRRRHDRDGRVVLLEPTDSGRTLVETELPRHVSREKHMLDGFTDDELTTLTSLLRRVAHNVEVQTRP